MRVLVLVHATPDSEQGNYADHADEFEAMGRYNEDLVKAGIMLAADGLEPSAHGKRLVFPDGTADSGVGGAAGGGAARVIDGPFAEAKEIIGGFWIWQVSSMEEAVQWLRRAPFRGQTVELRRIMEAADFEGLLPQEILENEARLRAKSADAGR